jgi:hypothetical protein
MNTDATRLVCQCKVLCGITLLHLRVFHTEPWHRYDVLIMDGTTWRFLARSMEEAHMTLDEAKASAEQATLDRCALTSFNFHWVDVEKPPKPSGRNRTHVS